MGDMPLPRCLAKTLRAYLSLVVLNRSVMIKLQWPWAGASPAPTFSIIPPPWNIIFANSPLFFSMGVGAGLAPAQHHR